MLRVGIVHSRRDWFLAEKIQNLIDQRQYNSADVDYKDLDFAAKIRKFSHPEKAVEFFKLNS